MKSQKNPLPLQPKWICGAAIGALTLGAIVGANAQNAGEGLPTPPKITAQKQSDLTAQRPRPRDGGGFDDEDFGPPPGDFGPPGGGPGMGGPDDFGPPEDGPDDFGPPGGPGIGGPEMRGPGGPGMGGPGMMGPPGMGGPGRGGPGRGGPGRGGPGRGGPGRVDENSADGSALLIERAYRTAGQASQEKLDGESTGLFAQARDSYEKAQAAYKAKSYRKASALANASEHLSKATLALSRPEPPAGPTGWTAPPATKAVNAELDQDRVSMSLNRAYRELQRPATSKDATVVKLAESAKKFYTAATVAFEAKRFDEANTNAIVADEIIQATRGLSDTNAA